MVSSGLEAVFSREGLDPLFNSVPFGIALISYPNLRFVRANVAYCSRLKSRPCVEELRNVDVANVLPNPSFDALEALRKAHQNQTITRVNRASSENFKGGTSYWDNMVAPLSKHDGQTLTLSFLTEITDREGFRTKVEENQKSLRLWVHRIRTPLTSIKTLNFVLQKKRATLSPDELHKHLNTLDQYVDRIADDLCIWTGET